MPNRDSIAAMYAGITSAAREGRSIFILRAFVDDSGSGGDSPYYVLAGFLSTVALWDQFTDRWCTELETSPRLEYFKSSEAESLKGQFIGYSIRERNQRIDNLIEIIQGTTLQAISVRVRQADFDSTLKRIVSPRLRNPYSYLFTCMVQVLAISARKYNLGGKVDVVLDRQNQSEKIADKIYRAIRLTNDPALPLGNVDFRDDRDFPPLQAADLLAWQIRRFWSTPNEPKRDHLSRAKDLPLPPCDMWVSPDHLMDVVSRIQGRVP